LLSRDDHYMPNYAAPKIFTLIDDMLLVTTAIIYAEHVAADSDFIGPQLPAENNVL
jgi:hypothetical protein